MPLMTARRRPNEHILLCWCFYGWCGQNRDVHPGNLGCRAALRASIHIAACGNHDFGQMSHGVRAAARRKSFAGLRLPHCRLFFRDMRMLTCDSGNHLNLLWRRFEHYISADCCEADLASRQKPHQEFEQTIEPPRYKVNW